MKKLLLLGLMLLGMGGVISVKAEVITNWDPSEAYSTTWNSETNTLSWIKDWANVLYTGFAPKVQNNTTEVDLSKYSKIHYNITSLSGTASDEKGAYIELKVSSTDKQTQNIRMYEGANDIVFADYEDVIDFSKILEVTVSATGANYGDPGSAVITEFYLYTDRWKIQQESQTVDSYSLGSALSLSDIVTNNTLVSIGSGNEILYGKAIDGSEYGSNQIKSLALDDAMALIKDDENTSYQFQIIEATDEGLVYPKGITKLYRIKAFKADGTTPFTGPGWNGGNSFYLQEISWTYNVSDGTSTTDASFFAITPVEGKTNTYSISAYKKDGTAGYKGTIYNKSEWTFKIVTKTSSQVNVDVWVEVPPMVQIDDAIALNLLPWIKIENGTQETPDWNIGSSTDTYYGNLSSDPTHYVDLTAYDELRIYRDNNDGFRAFFINASGSGTNNVNSGTWNAEEKYWSVDLSTVEKFGEIIALKSIKSAAWGQYNVIKNIVVIGQGKGSHAIFGPGYKPAAVDVALADENATLYDGTGLANTSAMALTPTNTNALFVVADAAKLSNTSNVVVKDGLSYSSTNIELVDGKPFYAPFNITSTASSYSRTTSAGEWATAVLPFDLDVTGNDDATYYTFTSATATSASFEEVTTGTIAANTPFLYQATGTSVEFVGGNISATIDGYNIQAIGETGWYIAQSMESKVIDDVTTDPFFKDYDVYGIAGDDLVHATKKLTTKPFRAFYLKPKSVSAGSRLLITIDDSEATAINEVDADADKVTTGAIYNMAGQQVDANYKGVVIDENGRKYLQK